MNSSSTILADYILLSRDNYIYPLGSLPSNFFFRRTQKNPYWLANELRNIKLKQAKMEEHTPEEK